MEDLLSGINNEAQILSLLALKTFDSPSLPSGVSLVAQTVKNLPAMQETWVGKIPWRREWQPTPVSLPGEFHGQRSLVGCSPWGLKELDMAESLTQTTTYKLLKFGSSRMKGQ